MIRFSTSQIILIFLFIAGCAHRGAKPVPLDIPTPELYRAAGKGDLQLLATASEKQINGANQVGTTLLMVAARRGSLAGVDYLLSKGASANAADGQKQTVLHYALPVRSALINTALIKAGADPSVEDQFGVVPAVMWAEEGSIESLLVALQSKERWCCFLQVKDEIKSILEAAKKKRKRVPPSLFIVLRELVLGRPKTELSRRLR